MNLEDKKLSSEELGERFDLLAADAKGYALFLLDLNGKLICWNVGAERLFGYQAHEIVGKHISCFFTPEDMVIGQPEHELKTALEEGHALNDGWQVRKDGTRFWCRVSVTPLLNENKQARSFARVMNDLTESEATGAQRKRADGLAEANRNKEEFMALLSHELRSPLSPIRNALFLHHRIRSSEYLLALCRDANHHCHAHTAGRNRPAARYSLLPVDSVGRFSRHVAGSCHRHIPC